jgi:very-short-patch-repair endonuclease
MPVIDKKYVLYNLIADHMPHLLDGLVTEHRFHPVRKFRFDYAYVHLLLGLELDAGLHLPNGGRHAGERDRVKLNLAASMGWCVLRFTPTMIGTDPEGCLQQIVDAYYLCSVRTPLMVGRPVPKIKVEL